jgi:hypothetical protein
MTTIIPSPAAVARRGTPVIENPRAPEYLELLAEAIRLAAPPAFFVVWQDGPDSMRLFVDALVQAGLTTPHVIRPDNLAAKLNGLEQRASLLSDEDGVVFLGCLSTLPEQEQKRFNAARDRLLALSTKVIFVESVADERKVRLGLPDVLSQVSYDCRLFLRDEEDPFATSGAPRQGADGNGEPLGTLSGTVQEVREAEALCWLEVGPGTRVKFSVPLSLLAHLNPQPGLDLLWSPGKKGELPTFRMGEPELPDPELIRQVNERYGRIRNTLKSWQPHLPEDK